MAAESKTPQPDMTQRSNKQLQIIMNYVMDSGESLVVNNYSKLRPPKNVPTIVQKYLDEFELHCISVLILEDAEGKLGVISMEGTYSSLVVQESVYVIDLLVNNATIAIRNAQLYQKIPGTSIGARFRTGVRITKKMWWKVIVGIALFALALTCSITIPVPAYVTADLEVTTDHKTQVSVMTNGVVKQVLFHEGDLVKKGQTLAILDGSLLKLEKAKLQKDIKISRGDLRNLASEGMPYEIQRKRLELKKLENQLEIIEKKLSYVRIRSTSDGRILTKKPEELLDKQVVIGEVIALIAAFDKKSCILTIDDKNVMDIKDENPVKFTLQSMPDKLFKGNISYVSQVKTEAENDGEVSGYLAYVDSSQLNENSAVRFGMSGKAKINTGTKTLYSQFIKTIIEKYKTRYKMLFL